MKMHDSIVGGRDKSGLTHQPRANSAKATAKATAKAMTGHLTSKPGLVTYPCFRGEVAELDEGARLLSEYRG
jgi:hypothetical protein